VLGDDVLQAVGNMIERVGPGDALQRALAAADHRMQQPALEAERLTERRAF
jgi:hypothetical protein